MRILHNLLEEREVEMGLIFKLAFKRLFLLSQVVARASLHVDKDSGQTDSFKVWPMLPVKRLTAGANE
jgi:hypothetical protein